MTHQVKHPKRTNPGSVKAAAVANAPVASGNLGHPSPACEDAIRLSAYQKWERAGKPPGDGVQFWLEAEQEQAVGK